jgi:hypothetical protein
VTRAPPGMQNMSKNMAKMSTYLARANKAPDGPNRSAAWPRGLPRHFDFPAGRVGGFGVHGSTGGATGAGFGLRVSTALGLQIASHSYMGISTIQPLASQPLASDQPLAS